MGEVFSSLVSDCKSSCIVNVANSLKGDEFFNSSIVNRLEESNEIIINVSERLYNKLEKDKIADNVSNLICRDPSFINKIKDELVSDFNFNHQIASIVENNINNK